MDINCSATIFTGEGTDITVSQYGSCFDDEFDRPLMGKSERDACDRFQIAINNACKMDLTKAPINDIISYIKTAALFG